MPPAPAAILKMLVPAAQGSSPEAGLGFSLELELEKVRLRLVEMAALSHADWMEHLSGLGFTEESVHDLDHTVSSLFDGPKLVGQLMSALREVKDIDNEAELMPALLSCMNPVQHWAKLGILTNAFPDPITALTYMARHIVHIVGTAIWLESARRRALEEPVSLAPLSDAEIADGVRLAELGLAQDVAEWPPY